MSSRILVGEPIAPGVVFMQYREDLPSEQEQFEVYRRIFCLAGNKPVVVRTADIGADKPVAHMDPGPQENPCLGLRAHRFFHFHPEILVTQVRAILRAAEGEHWTSTTPSQGHYWSVRADGPELFANFPL